MPIPALTVLLFSGLNPSFLGNPNNCIAVFNPISSGSKFFGIDTLFGFFSDPFY